METYWRLKPEAGGYVGPGTRGYDGYRRAACRPPSRGGEGPPHCANAIAGMGDEHLLLHALWVPFGAVTVALLLAATGIIYSVISDSASQRTHEIGIRTAVGPRRGDMLRMIVAQGMRLALLELAVGVAGALVLTRVMASLLFEVAPTVPLTFVAVAALMVAVLLLACFIPALRAMWFDPMQALRYE